MDEEIIKETYRKHIQPVLLLCDSYADAIYKGEQKRVCEVLKRCYSNYTENHIKPARDAALKAGACPDTTDAEFDDFKPILEGLLHHYAKLYPKVENALYWPLKDNKIQEDASNLTNLKRAVNKAESFTFSINQDGRRTISVKYTEGNWIHTKDYLKTEKRNRYICNAIFERVFIDLLKCDFSIMGDSPTYSKGKPYFKEIQNIIKESLPETNTRNDRRSYYINFSRECSELYSFIRKNAEILPKKKSDKLDAGDLICELLNLNFLSSEQKDRFIEHLSPSKIDAIPEAPEDLFTVNADDENKSLLWTFK